MVKNVVRDIGRMTYSPLIIYNYIWIKIVLEDVILLNDAKA